MTRPSEPPSAPPTAVGELATDPVIGAALVIARCSTPLGPPDLLGAAKALVDVVSRVSSGDLRDCEGMLVAQAHTLSAIFMEMSRRALTDTNPEAQDRYMRLGLKAQAQCSATVEALVGLTKRHPAAATHAVVRDANGAETQPEWEPYRVVLEKTEQIELFEDNDGQRLERRAARTAG